jgi:prepilin-type N-terminal cleavage/methylation domain-containing protein
MERRGQCGRGFSLIELLCVMAIISILASMLLGAAGRAYQRAKRFAGEMDGPAYLDEVRTKVARYAQAHPTFPELSITTLARECQLSSRCVAFLRSREVIYVPFSSADPDEKVVIVQIVGAGKAAEARGYPKGWLCSVEPP